MSTVSTIGERIKAVRQQAGLSQDRFAAILGYSKRALINWEQGESEPPIAILPTLRREYDVDPEWIVMGTDNAPSSCFRGVDWKRLERLEREVDWKSRDAGLALSTDQKKDLVQTLYDAGPKEAEQILKVLSKTLLKLMKER